MIFFLIYLINIMKYEINLISTIVMLVLFTI